jgi:hypothetical protein
MKMDLMMVEKMIEGASTGVYTFIKTPGRVIFAATNIVDGVLPGNGQFLGKERQRP